MYNGAHRYYIPASHGSRLDSERSGSKAVKDTAKEPTFSNGSSGICIYVLLYKF